tara:strand:- start:896 stop:1795 length:900 start_codon:yes stop_codon:yes gene_type:complete
MDIGGTNLKLGLINDQGKVVKHAIHSMEDLLSHSNFIEALILYLNKFVGINKITCGGVSSKGFIDSANGEIIDDVSLGKQLRGFSIYQILSDKYNAPFSIENDAKCYAWGEYKFGKGKKYKTFCCITLGTGIGCAYVDSGNLFSGGYPWGGVLGGHISIDRNGPKCDCGNIGCFEMYCSKNGILRILGESMPLMLASPDPIISFFNSVRDGNINSKEVFNDFLYNLATGLVSIINLHSPNAIILGGGIMNSSDIFLDELKEIVSERAFIVSGIECSIEKSTLGNYAPLLGAAFLPKMED